MSNLPPPIQPSNELLRAIAARYSGFLIPDQGLAIDRTVASPMPPSPLASPQAPPNLTPTANSADPVNLVLGKLIAGTPKDSPEIKEILEAQRQSNLATYELINKIVQDWPASAPAKTPAVGIRDLILGGGLLGALATNPYLGTLMGWIQAYDPLAKSGIVITSPGSLFVVVAFLGALAGAGYSLWVNRKVVSPAFAESSDSLVLTRFGSLNEILSGALAAIVTVGMSVVGLSSAFSLTPPTPPAVAPESATSPQNPSESKRPAASLPTESAPDKVAAELEKYFTSSPMTYVVAQEPVKQAVSSELKTGTEEAPLEEQPKLRNNVNMLTYPIIFSSLISGWYGARMRAFSLGQSLLQEVLARTATTPQLSQVDAERIRKARTPAEAAAIAAQVTKVIGAAISLPTAASNSPSPPNTPPAA
jgi:hypothetical protein